MEIQCIYITYVWPVEHTFGGINNLIKTLQGIAKSMNLARTS